MKNLLRLNIYKKIAFLSLTTLACSNAKATTWRLSEPAASHPDSVGIEVINGQEYVLYKIEKGDNYYQISRRYRTTVGQLTTINGNGTLALGQIVKVPTGRAAKVTPPANVRTEVAGQGFTEYIVSEKETLYAISRRFGITVDDIKKANNLKNNTIAGGMKLRIPNKPLAPEKTTVIDPVIVRMDSANDTEETHIATNRYGIREKSERGIGVWIDGLSGQGTSNLALHKTAPVGTILKITNPMTKSVTYAKVVGKFNDNADNQHAIVVMSKSAAASIGALDKRFQVEIAYGVPLEN